MTTMRKLLKPRILVLIWVMVALLVAFLIGSVKGLVFK